MVEATAEEGALEAVVGSVEQASVTGETLCGHGFVQVHLPCGVTPPEGLAVWLGVEKRGGHGDKRGHIPSDPGPGLTCLNSCVFLRCVLPAVAHLIKGCL